MNPQWFQPRSNCFDDLANKTAKHLLDPAFQMWGFVAFLYFILYSSSDKTSNLKTSPWAHYSTDLMINPKNSLHNAYLYNK